MLIVILSTIILIAIALLLIIRIYNRHSIAFCTSNVQLHNKTVIVTGASAGIGKEAATDFAKRGARVLLACRNREKAQKIADKIKQTSGNTNVHVRDLDTSKLSSVRKFAKEILETESRLDILVLNAGIAGNKEKIMTEDELELTMATNHFGHFLLINLLSGLLERSTPSRVVVTSSSSMMSLTNINTKDLNFREEKNYTGMRAYIMSKLCNVLMTKYLALHYLNKGVIVNCLCPGLVNTEIFDKSTDMINKIFKIISFFASRTEEEGAQTIIYLAVDEEVKNISGEFFLDCKIRKSNPLADDAGFIKKIWEASEDLVKLAPEESLSKSKS